MRKSVSMALVGAAALALSLGACTKPGSAAADPDAVKQALKADETKMNQQFKDKDTEGLASHYTDESFFVAGGTTADGSTEIRKVFADATTDKAFEVHFASDKIDVAPSGDMAYARGKFTEKYTDKSGKVVSSNGTYIAVYKKQDDGKWKVVEDIAAVDPASIKPVPPEKPATRAKMTSFG
jgi:uncharacterized protein (TIGR02246 family)